MELSVIRKSVAQMTTRLVVLLREAEKLQEFREGAEDSFHFPRFGQVYR